MSPGSWTKDLTPEQSEIVEEATAPIIQEFYPENRHESFQYALRRRYAAVAGDGEHEQAVEDEPGGHRA